MNDRVSLNPGRVLVTPENGGEAFYATLTRADNPTQEGDPINKSTLLKDTTCESLGIPSISVPNDAFSAIAMKFKLLSDSLASVSVSVVDGDGVAVKDVEISGMFGENGVAVYTNSSGSASGYVSEGSVTLRISGYADIEDISDTFTAVAGGTYTRTITVTRRTYLKLLSSASFRYSDNVSTVDVAVGGAGAGGNWGTGNLTSLQTGGTGGGDGEVTKKTDIVPESRKVYNAIIGAGGEIAASGGSSSFMGVTASGGKVNGGGTGGRVVKSTETTTNAVQPADSNKTLYADMTTEFAYGGKGGGGGADTSRYGASGDYRATAMPASGGSPAGGHGGGLYSVYDGGNGTDGFGGGGGGGGAYYERVDDGPDRNSSTPPGKGGSGCITVRIHVTA